MIEGKLHSDYVFIQNPNYVGYYALGSTYTLRVMFEKKPIWFHRKMMQLCLGWRWVDEPSN